MHASMNKGLQCDVVLFTSCQLAYRMFIQILLEYCRNTQAAI